MNDPTDHADILITQEFATEGFADSPALALAVLEFKKRFGEGMKADDLWRGLAERTDPA